MTGETKAKSMVIASGLGYGLAVGGVSRLSSLASSLILYGGIVGGLLGSFGAKGNVARIAEGVATTASGIFGMGLTTKSGTGVKALIKPSASGRKLIQTRASGDNKMPALEEGGIVF